MNDIQIIFNEPYSILYLLPYTCNLKLTSRQQKYNELKLIQCIVDISEEAIECFLKKKLKAFDAQVGENLCQIRAYKNIHLAKFWLDDSENRKEIENCLTNLKRFKIQMAAFVVEWQEESNKTKQYSKKLDSCENIVSFLKNYQLYFELSEDIIYLISCYFLTQFAIHKDEIPTGIDFHKITSKFNVSKHRSERITHRFQLISSKLGSDFIVKIASDLPLAKKYAILLSKLYQLSDVDRSVLPCYLVSEIIFTHCIQEKIPILFLIKRKALINTEMLTFVMRGNSFENIKSTQNDYALVILGENYNLQKTTQNYLNYLKNINLINLVLANTATHPQYAGNKLKEHRNDPFLTLFENNSEANSYSLILQRYKSLAELHGCSQEYKYEFFLKHIFASDLTFEQNKLQLNELYLDSKNLALQTCCKEDVWNERTSS